MQYACIGLVISLTMTLHILDRMSSKGAKEKRSRPTALKQ